MVYSRIEQERLQKIDETLRRMRKIIQKKSKRSSSTYFSQKYSTLLKERRELVEDSFDDDLQSIKNRLDSRKKNSERQYYEEKENIPNDPFSETNSKVIFKDHSFIVRVSLITGEVFMSDGKENETIEETEDFEDSDEEYIPPSYEDELVNNNMESDVKKENTEDIVEEISFEGTDKEIEEIFIEDSEGENDNDGYNSDEELYNPPGILLMETGDEIFISKSIENTIPLIDLEKEEEEIIVLHTDKNNESDNNGNAAEIEAIILD